MHEDLSAGRGLDVLVAEKVMGQSPINPPPYSSNIAIAWRIVETMAEQGYRMMLERLVSAGRIIREYDIVQDDRVYVCTFWQGGIHDMRGGLAPRSSSAPHAICLAALRTQEPPR